MLWPQPTPSSTIMHRFAHLFKKWNRRPIGHDVEFAYNYCPGETVPPFSLKIPTTETSLAIQWLRFCASKAGSMSLIPGQQTKMPHATQQGQKKKKKNAVIFYLPYTITKTQLYDSFHPFWGKSEGGHTLSNVLPNKWTSLTHKAQKFYEQVDGQLRLLGHLYYV